MKKIFVSIFCLLLLFFVSCQKIPIQEDISDLESSVAYELMQLDEDFSDETLKAMSVVIRTNLCIDNSKISSHDASEKYVNITKVTSGEVLKNTKGNLVEISFNSSDNYRWQKVIKKSELLEFALKNNVSLSNLKKIKPDIKNEKILGLEIAEKYFDYSDLAEEFGLESDCIENISQTKNEIIISGKNKGFYGFFDTKKAEQLSNNNYFYANILKDFFDNLRVTKN